MQQTVVVGPTENSGTYELMNVVQQQHYRCPGCVIEGEGPCKGFFTVPCSRGDECGRVMCNDGHALYTDLGIPYCPDCFVETEGESRCQRHEWPCTEGLPCAGANGVTCRRPPLGPKIPPPMNDDEEKMHYRNCRAAMTLELQASKYMPRHLSEGEPTRQEMACTGCDMVFPRNAKYGSWQHDQFPVWRCHGCQIAKNGQANDVNLARSVWAAAKSGMMGSQKWSFGEILMVVLEMRHQGSLSQPSHLDTTIQPDDLLARARMTTLNEDEVLTKTTDDGASSARVHEVARVMARPCACCGREVKSGILSGPNMGIWRCIACGYDDATTLRTCSKCSNPVHAAYLETFGFGPWVCLKCATRDGHVQKTMDSRLATAITSFVTLQKSRGLPPASSGQERHHHQRVGNLMTEGCLTKEREPVQNGYHPHHWLYFGQNKEADLWKACESCRTREFKVPPNCNLTCNECGRTITNNVVDAEDAVFIQQQKMQPRAGKVEDGPRVARMQMAMSANQQERMYPSLFHEDERAPRVASARTDPGDLHKHLSPNARRLLYWHERLVCPGCHCLTTRALGSMRCGEAGGTWVCGKCAEPKTSDSTSNEARSTTAVAESTGVEFERGTQEGDAEIEEGDIMRVLKTCNSSEISLTPLTPRTDVPPGQHTPPTPEMQLEEGKDQDHGEESNEDNDAQEALDIRMRTEDERERHGCTCEYDDGVCWVHSNFWKDRRQAQDAIAKFKYSDPGPQWRCESCLAHRWKYGTSGPWPAGYHLQRPPTYEERNVNPEPLSDSTQCFDCGCSLWNDWGRRYRACALTRLSQKTDQNVEDDGTETPPDLGDIVYRCVACRGRMGIDDGHRYSTNRRPEMYVMMCDTCFERIEHMAWLPPSPPHGNISLQDDAPIVPAGNPFSGDVTRSQLGGDTASGMRMGSTADAGAGIPGLVPNVAEGVRSKGDDDDTNVDSKRLKLDTKHTEGEDDAMMIDSEMKGVDEVPNEPGPIHPTQSTLSAATKAALRREMEADPRSKNTLHFWEERMLCYGCGTQKPRYAIAILMGTDGERRDFCADCFGEIQFSPVYYNLGNGNLRPNWKTYEEEMPEWLKEEGYDDAKAKVKERVRRQLHENEQIINQQRFYVRTGVEPAMTEEEKTAVHWYETAIHALHADAPDIPKRELQCKECSAVGKLTMDPTKPDLVMCTECKCRFNEHGTVRNYTTHQ